MYNMYGTYLYTYICIKCHIVRIATAPRLFRSALLHELHTEHIFA